MEATILAIVAAIAGVALLFQAKRETAEKAGKLRYGAAGAFCVAVVALLAGTVRVVPPGMVGVQVLFGKVRKDPLPSGLHFVNPFIDLTLMSVRTEVYTMSARRYEGKYRSVDDAISCLTHDGLSIRLDVSVWFHLDGKEAPQVFREIGEDYVEKIVRPAVRSAIRNQAANYLAADIYSQKREELRRAIENEVKGELKDRGVVLERVLLRNVELPTKLQQAINEKLAAEQEAQRMKFILQRERQEAERRQIEANGIAKSNQIIGKSLSEEYLQWYYITALERLINSPNNTVIILPFDQKLTPLLQVPSERR